MKHDWAAVCNWTAQRKRRHGRASRLDPHSAVIDRPERPCPELLEQARERAAAFLKAPIPKSAQWVVRGRADRPRSTLFPLELHDGRHCLLKAFYKQSVPRSGIDFEDAQRQAIQRSEYANVFAPDLRAHLLGIGVAIPVPLAADHRTLTEISTRVPGRPLGNTARQLMPTPGTVGFTHRYCQLGRALQEIQRCQLSVSARPPVDKGDRELLQALKPRLPAPEYSAVAEFLIRLREGAVATADNTIVAHGDVSSTNILLWRGGMSLVDFQWSPQLPHYDLAVLLTRLETEIPPGPWIDAAIGAVLSGYGYPTVSEHQAFQYTRLKRLCKIIKRDDGSPKSRRSTRRAHGRVRAVVEELREAEKRGGTTRNRPHRYHLPIGHVRL